MKIVKYMLMVEDYNKEGVKIYSLYSLDELDNLELAKEELKELLYSSKTESEGKVFKIISVNINVGEREFV